MSERYGVSPKDARHMLDHYGEKCDRLVDEHERHHITGICRIYAWNLEKTEDYPARRKVGVGNKKCGWLLSELLHWIHNQPLS